MFFAKRINTNEEPVVEKEPFQGELNFDVYAKRINTNEEPVVVVLIRLA